MVLDPRNFLSKEELEAGPAADDRLVPITSAEQLFAMAGEEAPTPARKRWSRTLRRDVQSPRIDAFLREVLEISRKHGFTIGHEDFQGSFLVSEFDDNDAEWLMGADDDTAAR